jgi:hypothetical protein
MSWPAEAARSTGGGGAGTPLPQQFVVQALLFVHGAQECGSYKGSASSLSLAGGARTQLDQLKHMAAEVAPVLGSLWSAERLRAFTVALVERLLPLTDKELEEWWVGQLLLTCTAWAVKAPGASWASGRPSTLATLSQPRLFMTKGHVG